MSTLQSWKKSRGLNVDKPEGSSAAAPAGTSAQPSVNKGKSERQKETKEMKKRTER